MRKFIIFVFFVFCSFTVVMASPSFQMISRPSQVNAYGIFECTFDLSTVAANYSWPYDTNTPVSINPGTGVSVDAVFINDATSTAVTVPCFYYQNYTRRMISGDGSSFSDEAVTPDGKSCWMVRFAPFRTGTWRFQLKATDASGSTIEPLGSSYSFLVVPSTSKGFVRVSPTDSRYFELSDGTPFVSPGVNVQFQSTFEAENMLSNLGSNGVKMARWWMSYRGWQNPFSGGDYPTNGGPQWQFSLKLSSNGGYKSGDRYSAMLGAGGNTYQNVYLDAGKEYRYSGYIKTSGIVSSTSGTGVIPYFGKIQGKAITGTSNWQYFSIPFVPISSGVYSVGVRNTGSSGTGYFDDVSLNYKNVVDQSWSANFLAKSDFDYQAYMDPLEAWKVDKIFKAASDNGVYLKTVISEKQDTCLGKIYSDGSIGVQSDNNFYGSDTHPTRWLQKAWWRYIIARWGAFDSVHSWELCNEGDPFNLSHYNAANALAGYMKSNDPYGHLSSTSFWHSIPMDFWKNSLCDYIDAHEYFGPSTTGTISHGPRFLAWNDPGVMSPNDPIIPISNTAGEVSLDNTVKYAGSRSLKIVAHENTTFTAGKFMASGSSYHVGIDPSHLYTISCKAKGNNINNQGGSLAWEKPRILITWSKAYHENDWVGSKSLDLPLGTYAWQNVSLSGIAPPSTANTANITFECIRGVAGSGDGTLWIDDVILTDQTTGEDLFIDGGFENNRIDYDPVVAVKKYGVLLNSYGKRIGRPTMMGETGIRGLNVYGSSYKELNYTEENQQLVDDIEGLHLKKTLWSHIGPNNPYMMLWWIDCIEKNNLWYHFKAVNDFMSGISVSNGKFVDINANVSNPAMRVIGQKDKNGSCAYLWIDNTAYTWKNAVDGAKPGPVTGTVTFNNMTIGSYVIEWWNTSTGKIISMANINCDTGNITLNVSNLVSDIACKVYYHTPVVTLVTVPAKPTKLIASNIRSYFVGLKWIDNSTNETGFYIQRSVVGQAGPWHNVGSVSANNTTFTDYTVIPKVKYWYKVCGYNSYGFGDASNIISIRLR